MATTSVGNEITIKQIISYLSRNNILCWEVNHDRTPKKKLRGIFDGLPHIMGILPDGTFLGIEVKSKETFILKESLDFMETANFFNGLVFIAETIDDVTRQLLPYFSLKTEDCINGC